MPGDPDGTEELPAATIEDGSEGEVQGRSGAMLKRGQVDADVEGDRKNRNAKPIKTRRAPKARKTKPQAADAEVTLQVNVAEDFFRGITQEWEAETILSTFVGKQFYATNA